MAFVLRAFTSIGLLLALVGGCSEDGCGAMGQKCCSDHQCSASDLGCFYTAANTVGTCVKCGEITAPCCQDGPACSGGPDVKCTGQNPAVCIAFGPCGQYHQRCCDMLPQCASGLRCTPNASGMPSPWCDGNPPDAGW